MVSVLITLSSKCSLYNWHVLVYCTDNPLNMIISMADMIGSGHFGVVLKGTWKSPGRTIPVAIKTANSEASKEEQLKFLQEAAIMGQFHHPNIVRLHGVVTMEQPVRESMSTHKDATSDPYPSPIPFPN